VNGKRSVCPVLVNPQTWQTVTSTILVICGTFIGGALLRLRRLPHAESKDMTAGRQDHISGIVGLADISSEVNVVLLLEQHRALTVFYATVISLVSSTVVSLAIALFFLVRVLKDVPAAKTWLGKGKNIPITSAILFLSMTKLESVRLLNFKIAGKHLIQFPMEYKHQLFIKQAGIATQLLENGPQILILLSAWDTLHVEKEGRFGISNARWTEMSLAFSGASLLYGVTSKMVTSVYVAADSKSSKSSKGRASSSVSPGTSSGSSGTSSSNQRRTGTLDDVRSAGASGYPVDLVVYSLD